MRNLVLYELVSVDGVAEEPGDWLFDAGDEVFSNLGRIIERQDDIILGRGTYDYWVDYWPTSDVEPFATFINSTTKHVATSQALDQPGTLDGNRRLSLEEADTDPHGNLFLTHLFRQYLTVVYSERTSRNSVSSEGREHVAGVGHR